MKEELNCGELLGFLSDYVDGELEQALCDEIERHIRACDDCRVVVDTLKKTIYLYHETSSKTTMPHGIRERLFHRLDLDEFIQQKNLD